MGRGGSETGQSEPVPARADQRRLRFLSIEIGDDLDDPELELLDLFGRLELAAGWQLWLTDDGSEAEAVISGDAAGVAEALREHGGLRLIGIETRPAPVLGVVGVEPISGGSVELSQDIVPGGFGEDDYETTDGLPLRISAREDGVEVGAAELLLGADRVRVRFIEVANGERRRGIAGALLAKVEELYGDWETNDFTAEGSAFIEAFRGRNRASG